MMSKREVSITWRAMISPMAFSVVWVFFVVSIFSVVSVFSVE